MEPIYAVSATTTGGRRATAKSETGVLNLEVRSPRESGGTYTNPEEIFATGYSACFDSAIHFVAVQQKLRITSTTTVKISMYKREEGGLILGADLEVQIVGLDQQEAERLVEQADHVCPYSNSIRGNVKVSIAVKGSR